MGMLRVAKQTGAITIIPNAGLGAATNELCGGGHSIGGGLGPWGETEMEMWYAIL